MNKTSRVNYLPKKKHLKSTNNSITENYRVDNLVSEKLKYTV